MILPEAVLDQILDAALLQVEPHLLAGQRRNHRELTEQVTEYLRCHLSADLAIVNGTHQGAGLAPSFAKVMKKRRVN
jgi:hypothetical protein